MISALWSGLVLFLLIIPSSPSAPSDLRPYIACDFGQFKVEEHAERDQPFSRTVETLEGDQQIEITQGVSLHIAYKGTPFANFKAETLGGNYQRSKAILISSLEYLNTQPGMGKAEPWHSPLNGFDTYAIHRRALDGGVLSMYELFRDSDETVVTLYILSTPPEAPQFLNMEQYRRLRDTFLGTYTKCAGETSKREQK